MELTPLFLVVVLCGAIEAQNAGDLKAEELFPEDCGQQKFHSGRRTARIVNGNDASFGEYPWQVAIFLNSNLFYCSGALINKKWILTVAHCMHRLSPAFRLGEHDRSHENEPMKYIIRHPEKIFIHPKYNSTKHDFDIALVKISSPVEFEPHIQPICLPDANEDESMIGRFARVTGWGSLYNNEKSSSILQEVSLPVVSNSFCRKVFHDKDRQFNPETTICAGFPDGKRSTCKGDSGGPLQFERVNERWVIIGLVSWSVKPCAEKNHLDAFTRVSAYIPWMRKVMWQNYDEKQGGGA